MTILSFAKTGRKGKYWYRVQTISGEHCFNIKNYMALCNETCHLIRKGVSCLDCCLTKHFSIKGGVDIIDYHQIDIEKTLLLAREREIVDKRKKK